MNLFVLEPDADLTRLLERMLSEAGHSVRRAATGPTATAMLAATPADVLILARQLGEEDALDWLARARGRERSSGAPPARVILLVEPHGTPARARLDALAIDHVVPKPPSLLDLLDLVSALRPGMPRERPTQPHPPEPSEWSEPRTVAIDASPGRSLDLPNLARIGGWWAEDASGVVRADLPGGTTRWIPIASGGPVGEDGLRALVRTLNGGALEFDPCDVDGPGDGPGLARELWRAARAWLAGRPPVDRDLLVRPGPGVRSARFLPVGERARVPLSDLSQPALASELARGARVSLPELIYDLHTLSLLGLVTLHPAPEVAQPPLLRSEPTLPHARADLRHRPIADAPFAPLDDATRATVFTPAPKPPPLVDVADLDPPTDRTTPNPALVAQQVVRLRREARLVEAADPWTVLALPRGSSIDVVRQAVARMEARYEALARSAHPDVRACATRILERVRAAEGDIRRDGSAREPTEELLVAAGRAQLARGDWTGADRRFGAARDLSPSSPVVLALLGWARFHNPAFAIEERQEEGVALVDLALAFDAHDPDALFYRASLAVELGEKDTAQRHLSELLRDHPGHASGHALAARLHRATGS